VEEEGDMSVWRGENEIYVMLKKCWQTILKREEDALGGGGEAGIVKASHAFSLGYI
jgi:hypothetical protein